MQNHYLDKTKLLGFAANGEPLFDIVLGNARGSSAPESVAGGIALGDDSKLEGLVQLAAASRLTGESGKDN
jgi:hypothetical protein